MNEVRCEWARDLIPDHVAARLSAAETAQIAAHLEVCAECRAEADVARLILAGQPQLPPGLAKRIRAAVRADRRPTRRPGWGLAAAAVAVLAVGIGVASRNAQNTTPVVPGYVAEGTTTESWINEDGTIAGAPALDGLSDDGLRTLLNELNNSGTGGSA